jgi:hypothetical protein
MRIVTPTAPGNFLFTDQPGNDQFVQVVMQDGELRARFDSMNDGDELVLVSDMAGEWADLDEEPEEHVRQRGQPYFVSVMGAGADTLTGAQRVALEESFRIAFDKVCGDLVLRVVHAHSDFNEDILDPRSGGPGFYHDLERKAVALMDIEVPKGVVFNCHYNFDFRHG